MGGGRKSWKLKMAGEGSDDWAPLEAEDMVPDLTQRFRGTRSWRKVGKSGRMWGKSRKRVGRGTVTGAAHEACRDGHAQWG